MQIDIGIEIDSQYTTHICSADGLRGCSYTRTPSEDDMFIINKFEGKRIIEIKEESK